MTYEETVETGSENERRERLLEGVSPRAMEQVARAPSSMWLWVAGAGIASSLALFLSGRRQEGLFVGLWPLTLLVMGNYPAIVKSIGSTSRV